MKKYFVITALISLVISVCSNSFGQTHDAQYNSACLTISSFHKLKFYNTQMAGQKLSSIFDSLVYYQCVTNSELKYRLLTPISVGKLNKEIQVPNWIEGDLLALLYYSRQTGPRPNLSNEDLAALLRKKDGVTKIINSVLILWDKPVLNNGLVDTLQDYRPETAMPLAYLIAEPFWKHPAKIPEQTQSTQVSRDLWQAYYELRLNELVRRSVALRLLVEHGVMCIPAETYVGNVKIVLDPLTIWNQYDIDGLYRIIDDPFADPWFCDAARAKLHSLGRPY
ncbi:MAG: hypothetical protein PHG25_00080 [Candidatus Pacebacteria bacterium]|nr:hypothetical protein [Candidatus Paceibacterota bacterium]